ncbi:MAG: N-acetylneuraminate synthase family protein [Pelagibacteraceae bacterium]|nr:N-acetylneuraminate synthase family protein [Pelagibacteraceae bacterium]
MKKTKIIAEIGWNHMGDMTLAKKMIISAKENGADFVKFQTWSVDRLKAGPWDQDGRREIYEKAELSVEQHLELFKYSKSLEIPMFSSVFSIEDAKMLSQIDTVMVKIASFESRNTELLKCCDELFDTIIISTGTSTVDEVRESIQSIEHSDVVFLHCVSAYPLEYKNVNLPRINSLRNLSGFYPNAKVGYSDHTPGVEGSKVALEYDIDYIEKHFTVDQDLPGRDNKFAILPHELKELSEYIKIREEMNISHGDGYLECEEESRAIMTGRFSGT